MKIGSKHRSSLPCSLFDHSPPLFLLSSSHSSSSFLFSSVVLSPVTCYCSALFSSLLFSSLLFSSLACPSSSSLHTPSPSFVSCHLSLAVFSRISLFVTKSLKDGTFSHAFAFGFDIYFRHFQGLHVWFKRFTLFYFSPFLSLLLSTLSWGTLMFFRLITHASCQLISLPPSKKINLHLISLIDVLWV